MDPRPLDLRDYFSILWAWKWTITAIVLTTTAVALAYSFEQTLVYTSSAEVIVLPASFNPTVSSAESTALNMLKEEQVANSALVERAASLRLTELDITPGTMLVSQVEDADTLVFTSEAPDPSAAQATAGAYANAYLSLRRSSLIAELKRAREPYASRLEAIEAEQLEIALSLGTAQGVERELLTVRQSVLLSEQLSTLSKLNELAVPENVEAGRVLRSAERPSSPSEPNHTRDGVIALVVGLALGIGVALLRDRLDQRVRGRAELELRAGAPVLGLIPPIPRARFKSNTLLVTLSRPDSESADAFKALRVRLMHAVNHRPAGSIILVTSSLAGEGKTTVLANLGVVLAMAGKRVVMVAADLRRPRLQTYFPGSDFSRSGGAGLTEVLTDKWKAQEALSTTGTKNLLVLHVGRKANAAGPSDLLGSARMTDLLAELRDLADFILIDTPPLLASSDVVTLASLADGVLFVVDPRLAHGSNIEQARHELDIIDVALIGIVVNRHDPRWFRTYGSGHGYYGEGREQRPGEVAGETLQTEPASTEYRPTSSPGDRDPGDVPIP